MDVSVRWARCHGQGWHRLDSVDPMDVALDGVRGVYLVWQADPPQRAVRVGKGYVRDELGALAGDADVQRHAGPNGLLVTWARVGDACADGVVRFLADAYAPLVEPDVPLMEDVEPVRVQPLP